MYVVYVKNYIFNYNIVNYIKYVLKCCKIKEWALKTKNPNLQVYVRAL